MLAAVVVRDPHLSGSWGTCWIRDLTGWYCPGCGGLRALNDLAHANLLAAAGSNLYLTTTAVLAVVVWAAWLRARLRGEPFVVSGIDSRWAVGLGVGGLVVFTVLRNLAVGAVLAP